MQLNMIFWNLLEYNLSKKPALATIVHLLRITIRDPSIEVFLKLCKIHSTINLWTSECPFLDIMGNIQGKSQKPFQTVDFPNVKLSLFIT